MTTSRRWTEERRATFRWKVGLKVNVDYEEKFNEMESLRGVSHLVFKDLKSGSNRLTFLDLLRILLVTSNPDDLKVCESWVKE